MALDYMFSFRNSYRLAGGAYRWNTHTHTLETRSAQGGRANIYVAEVCIGLTRPHTSERGETTPPKTWPKTSVSMTARQRTETQLSNSTALLHR